MIQKCSLMYVQIVCLQCQTDCPIKRNENRGGLKINQNSNWFNITCPWSFYVLSVKASLVSLTSCFEVLIDSNKHFRGNMEKLIVEKLQLSKNCTHSLMSQPEYIHRKKATIEKYHLFEFSSRLFF